MYWMVWSCALWLIVYVSALWRECRSLMTTRGMTFTSLTAEVRQHRDVGGDDGIDRHSVKTYDGIDQHSVKTSAQLSTAGYTSSTVVRKQFHVAAVAIFLPGLLMDVSVLRMAVSCSLVVLVMLEAGADELFCRMSSATSVRCVQFATLYQLFVYTTDFGQKLNGIQHNALYSELTCQSLKWSTQVQYNYNNMTQKFCCIAEVCTSAMQLQYKFFCCK